MTTRSVIVLQYNHINVSKTALLRNFSSSMILANILSPKSSLEGSLIFYSSFLVLGTLFTSDISFYICDCHHYYYSYFLFCAHMYTYVPVILWICVYLENLENFIYYVLCFGNRGIGSSISKDIL